MPLLIVAYPLLAHLGSALHDLRLQWAALACLAAIPLYGRLRAVAPGAWLAWIAIAAALYGLVFMGGAQYALYVPPVVLPSAAAMLFAESLLPGRTPLVTRIARAATAGAFPPSLRAYTRGVTVVWVAVLAGIALVAAILAAFAPLHVWSLFTNMICYVIIAAVFPLEYLWRRLRHREVEHPGFWTYVKQVSRINYRKV